MAGKKYFLAGDIGGTKTNIAIFSLQGGNLSAEIRQTFQSRDYFGLEPVLKDFLRSHGQRFVGACFGVAGPVIDGRVRTPNLPWVIRGPRIAKMLNIESVALLNDLEATGYGTITLQARELITLNRGRPRRPGNKAIIAAGTGLGQAVLYDDGRHYHPSPSEGGHGDFAPRDETEIELLRYLIAKFGHVSYERVISGPGIWNIYQFLTQSGRFHEPDWLKEKLAAAEDPSATVTGLALASDSEICMKALDLFVSIYGAEAGNLALRSKALGGLYIGGGIAPKIAAKLKDGTFMRAFLDKGRYGDFLSSIRVQVILNEETALQGAAYYAAFRSQA